MIVISGFMEIDADSTEEFARISAELSVASRAEDGCTDYRFARSIEDPSRFDIFEEWDDEAALAAHGRAAHYRSWQRALRDLGVRRASVVRHTVDERSVLM